MQYVRDTTDYSGPQWVFTSAGINEVWHMVEERRVVSYHRVSDQHPVTTKRIFAYCGAHFADPENTMEQAGPFGDYADAVPDGAQVCGSCQNIVRIINHGEEDFRRMSNKQLYNEFQQNLCPDDYDWEFTRAGRLLHDFATAEFERRLHELGYFGKNETE